MAKKLKVVAVTVLLFLFVHMSYTTIAQDFSVYITVFASKDSGLDISAQVSTSTTQNTISAYYDDINTYYLFLPSYAEDKKIIIETGDSIHTEPVSSDITTYLINDAYRLVILYGSSLPSIHISLENELSYITADKQNSDSGQIIFYHTNGTIASNSTLKEIKGRGNYTWSLDKKPFNIKLEEPVSIYGMPFTAEYALVASSDMSFVRNRISQELASCMNAVSLDYTLANLYINGEYQGIYELWERITPTTLGIYDLEEETKQMLKQTNSLQQLTTGIHADDWNHTITGKWWNYEDTSEHFTGGYLLESDYPIRYDAEASGFILDSGAYIVAKSPEYLSERQYNYISTYIKDCEKAMSESVGLDNYDLLQEYIDIDSFIAKYLIEEISKNLECSSTSQFFYKDIDGVLYAGPAWDYDSAYGDDEIVDEINYEDPIGFSAKNVPGTLVWWQLLYYNKAFYNDMTDTYVYCVYPYLNQLTETTISEWKDELSASAVMDYLKWSHATSYETAHDLFENKIYFVSDFLKARKEFLYNEWN
ncbi:MAG: hypothetical protein E7290_11280 [Lachnospiraceae bacterium]|nr:hypothetical protein [Lachnospiraceae bacterium]